MWLRNGSVGDVISPDRQGQMADGGYFFLPDGKVGGEPAGCAWMLLACVSVLRWACGGVVVGAGLFHDAWVSSREVVVGGGGVGGGVSVDADGWDGWDLTMPPLAHLRRAEPALLTAFFGGGHSLGLMSSALQDTGRHGMASS